ncbi:MAG: hypothetical protein WDO73_14040 [Ignavibacteriota bacterium]
MTGRLRELQPYWGHGEMNLGAAETNVRATPVVIPTSANSGREQSAGPISPSLRRVVRLTFLLLLTLLPIPARAVELHLQFGALERMIAEAVFTQDGRRYVHNDKSNKCNFAYLEKPQIQGADGRLRIRAKFTGRSALNVIGQCVGLGDAFVVVMMATPEYRNGNIVLQNVTASSDGKTGMYIRKVCGILGSSLERDFKYPLAAEAKRILEDASGQPGYKRELHDFQVPAIRVSDDSLVIQADFALVVK